MGFLSRLAQSQGQAQGQASAPAPRPTLIQGGPAFFTPEGYVPPVQPEQAFLPTDVMRDPIADMFAAQPRGPILPKPPIPPKDDQLFIDDMPPMREEPPVDFPMPTPMPGDRKQDLPPTDMLNLLNIGKLFDGTFDFNNFKQPPTPPPLPESVYGAGKRYDPANLPEGFSFQDTSGMMRTMVMPPPGFVYAYGPDGERRAVPSGEPGAAEMRDRPRPSLQDLMTTGTQELIDRSGGQQITPPPATKPDMLPNLATGVMEPVGQPMPQLPQGPQPIPQVPSPVMPPMREVPPEPMPMENIIRANDPAIMPMPAKMPMLPEPMPMPSPMPIRPRMPMPGPIATPMPMAPTKLELPQIEKQMPMMSLDRGIGSFRTLV